MRKITIKQFTEVSITDIEDAADETYEPYAVLRAKTERIAELLGCDESIAERIVLDRIDSYLR